MPKVMIAYIPVLHQGYRDFLRRNIEAGAKKLFLVAGERAREWGPTHKDLHALSAKEIKLTLSILTPELDVYIIENEQDWMMTSEVGLQLVLADELVMRGVVEKMKVKQLITEKTEIEWQNIFLRWDRKIAQAECEPKDDEVVSETNFDRQMMKLASEEGSLSADWWRQVGAILCKEGRVLALGHNQHLPQEQQANIEGDIRGQFHKGEAWELGTAIHAEAGVIARCARRGVKIEGGEMYVTDFPCPNCAKLIVEAGIKKVYYRRGYAVSDGERVLKAAGVEIVRVKE